MITRHCVTSSQSSSGRIQNLLRRHILPACHIHTNAHIHTSTPIDGSSRYDHSLRTSSSSLSSKFVPRTTYDVVSVGSRCRYFATIVSRGGDGGADELHTLIQKEMIASEEEPISKEYKRVYIAVGANMGDRFTNLMNALAMLEETTVQQIDPSDQHEDGKEDNGTGGEALIRLIRTSFLRETEPMYVKDQPSFLNGAVEIETRLSPHALLLRLKDVESQIGRDFNGGVRYGPRPIDLDILYYDVQMNCNESNSGEEDMNSFHGGDIVQSSLLDVPHPRIQERDFVLSPLCDLNKRLVHPSINLTSEEMLCNLDKDGANTNNSSDEEGANVEEPPAAVKVLPLQRGRMLAFNQTHIMGILNVTPDSFSDGGNYEGSVDKAVQQALQLVEDGATIIDIGGESTRPGAKEVEIEIELERTIPVIRKLREGKSFLSADIITRDQTGATTLRETWNTIACRPLTLSLFLYQMFQSMMFQYPLIHVMHLLQKRQSKQVQILSMMSQVEHMTLSCLKLWENLKFQ